MASNSVEKAFCTTREAGALLGVSVGTVQSWVESGLLEAWKTAGGHRRVVRGSVDRLLHKTNGRGFAIAPDVLALDRIDRVRVVVVDDDPVLLRSYQVNLENCPSGPELTCVDNAVAALMLLGRGGPDLLIVDLMMPGMDGFHMLRLLSQAPEVADTKVVVVSALEASDIAQRGGVPRGVEVLRKPVPFDRLMQIVAEVAKRKRVPHC